MQGKERVKEEGSEGSLIQSPELMITAARTQDKIRSKLTNV